MDKLKQFIADNRAKIIWGSTIVLVLVALFVFGVWRYGWDWTGFYGYPTETQSTTSGNITTVKSRTLDKTLWDWMELLIIPAVLAGGAILLNRAQRQRELDIAEKERETERQIAKDREEERALQSYLEAMTRLILEENLRKSKGGSEVRSIARARTLTVLRSLNDVRKGSVLRFLYESGLIDVNNTIIHLREANLSKVNLIRGNLKGANLSGANLGGANLLNATLTEADLSKAELQQTVLANVNLQKANLTGTNLSKAFLMSADLREANLKGAILLEANLLEAKLNGVANLKEAFLIKAAYNNNTTWPTGFDPEAAGAVYVGE